MWKGHGRAVRRTGDIEAALGQREPARTGRHIAGSAAAISKAVEFVTSMPTRSPVLAATSLALGLACAASAQSPVAAILTSARARTGYLAHARMWSDPGSQSPDEIITGPTDVFPYSAADALSGLDCTFVTPGQGLGGKSAKFVCATSEGRTLRVKYWDREQARGNREVFAVVAATRLLWALGFDALPALPMNLRCDRCPSNPMTGDGPRSSRPYVAEMSVYPPRGPWILSREDRDQGWSWRELDEAIKGLPQGPERTRQRTHFDALTLLAVFMQHGDRKPEQQALYCAAPVDMAAGDRQIAKAVGLGAILVERRDSPACSSPAVVIVDAGVTFGGAGRTSSGQTATMNLDEWRSKTVFKADESAECHGRLTVSLAAGRHGDGDPEISEDGRRFLLEQLHRLTPAHVRAIFTAARVDLLPRSTPAAASGTATIAIDEWVAAFEDKVHQIEARRCQPASSSP